MSERGPASPYLTGQLLIAMPGMRDERFARSVIYMCAHTDEGAMGLVLNQIIESLTFNQLLGQLGIDESKSRPDVPVHFGGPVEPRRGFVLHSTDWAGDDTVDVAGRWALSGTIDILKAIAEGRGPSRWLVALGYAGWGAGQLDGEMLRHGWFNVAGDERLLFDTEADDRWTAGFERAGIDPRLLASQTGTA